MQWQRHIYFQVWIHGIAKNGILQFYEQTYNSTDVYIPHQFREIIRWPITGSSFCSNSMMI